MQTKQKNIQQKGKNFTLSKSDADQQRSVKVKGTSSEPSQFFVAIN